MRYLLNDIRHTPLLWLLLVVPVVLIGERIAPDAHLPLFVLSMLAIVPLAALPSRATESVAVRTGDAGGGLLNASLGNLGGRSAWLSGVLVLAVYLIFAITLYQLPPGTAG